MRVFSFSSFREYQLLVEVELDIFISDDSDIVRIAIVHSDHALYNSRVLLVPVFEELVKMLIECDIHYVYVLCEHKVSEIIIVIQSHCELPDSESSYRHEVGGSVQISIEIIEHVIARFHWVECLESRVKVRLFDTLEVG
jgi:hypothetical protein